MKFKIYLLVAVILSSSLLGCNGELKLMNNDAPIEDIEYLIIEGGEVNLPLTPFGTLNPLMTNNTSYHYFSKLIFEGLFEFDENLKPLPRLASTYTSMDNGVLVKLRNDVYWHDGEQFTADDVVFTVNTINSYKGEGTYMNLVDSALGAFTSGISGIGARKIDDYTVEISFPIAFSNMKEVLTFPIIPSHIFQNGRPNSYSQALALDNYIPIGTGPFMFESYDKNKSIKLVANSKYRDGEPSISIVNGKVLDDEELFLTAFEAGQIDITPTRGVDWAKYQQNSNVNIKEYITSQYEFLGFNFSKEIFQGEHGIKLRQAMNYGIDTQEIIQKIYLGQGTRSDVPINPTSWLKSDTSIYYSYNLDKSKELLASLGYMDIDEDGILEDNEGNELALRLTTNSPNLYRMNTAQMIAEDLKSIGINIILDFRSTYDEDITEEETLQEWNNINSKIKSGDFDIALLGWNFSAIPELSFLFHSSQIEQDNFIRYMNPELDQLLLEINNSINEELKAGNYGRLQEIIMIDLPYISLLFRNRAILINSEIKGDLNPTFFNPYQGLEKCFIALIPD